MAKTVEQILESRELADKFHEAWEAYHNKLGNHALKTTIPWAILVGVILPLFCIVL